MHPHALTLALVDDLLVASTLADDVEQLTQSLGLLRWHDVSGLPSKVLAILHATDGLIDVPTSVSIHAPREGCDLCRSDASQ